jgi:hypothetical protein
MESDPELLTLLPSLLLALSLSLDPEAHAALVLIPDAGDADWLITGNVASVAMPHMLLALRANIM